MSDEVTYGYALSFAECCGWGYRTVSSEDVLAEGEVFYPSYESFPQDVRDWLAMMGY